MSNKVALLFGYGPHVGVDVADAFKAKGYQVAVVSRSKKHIDRAKDLLFIQADLTDPKSVVKAFTTIIDEYGHPSVVIFNGTVYFPTNALPFEFKANVIIAEQRAQAA